MPSDDRPQSERPLSKPQPKVAGSRPRQARPRFTLPYTVDPKDEQTGFLTGIERLQRDAKSGGYGVFASVVVHGLLILLLGLIVFQTRHTADGDPLIAIWSQPGERAERAAKSRRSIAVPIEVASIRGDRPPAPPPVNPMGEETTTAPIGIAPVNVTEVVMLDARLLGIEETSADYLASVEFSGMIRENPSTGPAPFREVWNMSKPKDGSAGWLVAGVQALQ